MPQFVCNFCGETLKRNQIERHAEFKCKGCDSFSCVDCGVDLCASSILSHVSCVTEGEKYQKKLYKARVKRGQIKQDSWNTVLLHLKIWQEQKRNDLWKAIGESFKTENGFSSKNLPTEEQDQTEFCFHNSKKFLNENPIGYDTDNNVEKIQKFKWRKAIIQMILAHPEKKIKVGKLERKIIKKFAIQTGIEADVYEEQLKEHFRRKLLQLKNKVVEQDDSVISLCNL